MTSVFIQSDTPNQWLPAQDWQVGLLMGTSFVGSGKNKSNTYLAIPHEAQSLFGDSLPQLSSNVVTNLSESLDKAIKLLGEISSRFSEPRPVTNDHTVRFMPVHGTVFGSKAAPLSISDMTLSLASSSVTPSVTPAVPALALPSVTPPVPPSVPALPVPPATSPVVHPVTQDLPDVPVVPAQAPTDGGCSAAASDNALTVSTPPATDNAALPVIVSPAGDPTLIPVTVTTVPPVSTSLVVVPASASPPVTPSAPIQAVTVNVPLPAVPVVTSPPPAQSSSLLNKFFASAPVPPPAPPTMGSVKSLVQPFLEASNNIRAADIATFEPRFGEVLTRLAQVLFQTRQVLQSDDDFKVWKQLAETFFKLRQVVSDRKRSGVLCNLRTGTSRLYLITSLSQAEVNKRYTHTKPFMLEPASLKLLQKFA